MEKRNSHWSALDTFLGARNTFRMKEALVHDKAERIRDVIRYLRRFKNATVIIHIDDAIIDSPVFTSHIRDIGLLHESGLKVIVVPGARKRINEVLASAGISWSYHEDCRITDEQAMPLIKMAAFDVSNQVMTALAGERKNAVIGNWVRARGKGVINGIDYGTSGEIDKLQDEALRTILADGFIPIFPCIGWSGAGKPYNISSIQLSEQIAVHLQADKLFFLLPDAEITNGRFIIPQSLGLSGEGTVPAMNLEEVDEFVQCNTPSTQQMNTEHSVTSTNFTEHSVLSLLILAKQACLNGVSRVHILNGSLDGTLPCEIFSDFGSGTMIYTNNYGGIRDMRREDVSAVMGLMQPFIKRGILLPRTEQQLISHMQNYIVYELDGAIRACASLVPYSDGQMEIAGVAVDEACSHIGAGPKLISFLLERAKKMQAHSVFLLTTQTADWFENFGFVSSTISSLPQKRKDAWTPQRNSKVMRLNLTQK